MAQDDPFDLGRFVAAQAGTYADAVAELERGAKRSHWIWFVLPQIEGLGHSWMAQRYAISGLAEARAYLAHPLLGARLLECTRTLNRVQGRPVLAIFSPTEALKFRSSMTLFEAAAGPGSEFSLALEKYFGGERDPATLARLGPLAPG